MRALRLLAAWLLFAAPANAQFSGASSLNGGTANPQIPDLSMCLTPPTTFPHIWYVDPNAANGGNGSQATPWNSLQALANTVTGLGFSTPLLTTAGGGPVAPGDEVLLMSGTASQYGAISVSAVNNSSFVTIAAAPGQTPVLTSLVFTNSSEFVVSNISAQGTLGPNGALFDANWSGTSTVHDIIFDHLTGSSADNATVATWTQTDWQSNATKGVYLGNAGGTTTNQGYCITLTNSHLFNVRNGLGLFTDSTFIWNNEIDHCGDDIIDFGASNLVIKHNYLHDSINIGDGVHMDGMQGFHSPQFYHDLLIDSNLVLFQTDAALPFTLISDTPQYNDGIGEGNKDWTRLVITNNIITWGNHGIGVAGCRDCVVAGNSTLPGYLQYAGIPVAGDIGIFGQNPDGVFQSANIVVRNNYSAFLTIFDPTAIVEDNMMSISAATSGASARLIVNGSFIFPRTPGTYGTNNVIDSVGPAGQITTFNNVGPAFAYDFHLLSSAPARGFGVNTTPTPTVDIDGLPRAPTHDVGAHVFH